MKEIDDIGNKQVSPLDCSDTFVFVRSKEKGGYLQIIIYLICRVFDTIAAKELPEIF